MKYSTRSYDPTVACVFRSTKAKFGGLSNMAAGYPLAIGAVQIRTSEALYQVCRFPHRSDIQEAILREHSPMSAKMVSKKQNSHTRQDWERVKVRIMSWCLRVKLAHNFETFGRLLETTGALDIVESSRRDAFWGAVAGADGRLVGVNALGRLLMDLRRSYNSADRYQALFVPAPSLDDFNLLGRPITEVDMRKDFLDRLDAGWSSIAPTFDTGSASPP
jgi:ribA/ribD-fused uncharacterized protein